MIENLLLGLPGDRPGGLVLTVGFAIAAALIALALGYLYAACCMRVPRLSIPVQAAGALLRGVPLILMVFFLAQTTALSTRLAGLAALTLYSYVYVGEILRSFLASYPAHLAEQARVMGMGGVREWVELRAPWGFASALDALGTHWISLLKDTGALVVLGIGELTLVAKVLSEGPSYDRWVQVLLTAAGLYLAATLALIYALHTLRKLPFATAMTKA